MNSQDHLPKREMTECPICCATVRADRLVRHIRRVHESKQKLPVDNAARPFSQGYGWHGNAMLPKTITNKREVPKTIPQKQDTNAKHLKVPAPTNQPVIRHYVDDGSRADNQSNLNFGSAPLPRYIIDEFGVVHTYDAWKEDQSMGDHHVADRPGAGKLDKYSYHPPVYSWATCPECHQRIKSNKLNRHLKKVHLAK